MEGGFLNSALFSIILFVFAFLVYWVNAFFIIYHLVRFGIGTQPKIVALFFFMGSIVFFMSTVISFTQIDIAISLQKFNQDYLHVWPTPLIMQ